MHFVYVIMLEDCVYVGRTYDLPRRMSEHGFPPNWFVLEVTTEENIRCAEAKWAKSFSDLGVPLLNLADDFSGGVLNHSEATRKYLSDLQKGICKPKQSEIMKELWRQPEFRALMKDRPVSPTAFKPGYASPRKGGHREDISSAVRERMRLKAKKYNDEHGNPRQGAIVSQETRDKISQANKGRIPWNKKAS